MVEDVVVVVEDVVVVVDDVVVVGGTVVVVEVVVEVVVVTTGLVVVVDLTVVVGGSVVDVVVVGVVVVVDAGAKVVGPKLVIASGAVAFLSGVVVDEDNTTTSASFETTKPVCGTKAGSALYSGFFKSRSSSGGNPGLTVETCSAGASSMSVLFKSV